MENAGREFERLVAIMATLRGPNGCPWDKEQTYKDINPYMLEEVHEVMESVDAGDMEGLKEELGDLLLHIVFHAQMAAEDGSFGIYDVIRGICDKLVHRHPHVFAGARVKDSAHVIKRWEAIKKAEKGKKSVLDGVPQCLPALLKAYRLGEKAGRIGFDWQDADGILDKLQEEVRELQQAASKVYRSPSPLPSPSLDKLGTQQGGDIEDEYGDLLFTLANIGRFLKINPEEALRKSTNKFMRRFRRMEVLAEKKGMDIDTLSPEEWDKLWENAKSQSS